MACKLISCTGDKPANTGINADKPENKFYKGKGVGPVIDLKLDSISIPIAQKGEKVFESKCLSCHQMTDERKIGPGLKGVTLRRRPEWIMNQILNPMEMTKKDSLAKELLSIYLTQMVPMNLSYDEAREVLEYFRKMDTDGK